MQENERILHIGAHRTGTTSMQHYLQKNEQHFSTNDIRVLIPPHTRHSSSWHENLGSGRFIISEENIAGTMENCLASGKLYPNIKERIETLDRLITNQTTIFFTMRRSADWWRSVATFCVSRGLANPSRADFSNITNSDRGWADVVRDIRQAAPQARIVVREFEWKRNNPKQQLLQTAQWDELRSSTAFRDVHNKAPVIEEIIAQLIEREDFEAVRETQKTGLSFFTQDETDKLDKMYQRDLEAVANMKEVAFYSAPTSHRIPITADVEKLPQVNRPPPPRCILHIGKTGGTYLKSRIRTAAERDKHLHLCDHSETLVSTLKSHGRNRKIGFFFRDPQSRFASAFLSRMRQGRPIYNSVWSTAEAISFSFFESPNHLAESLYSKDERLRSAADFAMGNIQHLKLGMQYFLHSPAAVDYEWNSGNIIFCCETHSIDSNWSAIIDALALSQMDRAVISEDGIRHHGTEAILSENAKANLRVYLKREYDIYEKCSEVSRAMGMA
ncbi:hypothetical protein [Pseudoroseicyclus tamaricis]|uniref:Sulfotransferase family protein n=1 Tax=Pseudoroseicyclus tamaricis TaxID=2705421 RepID=A0A6B2JX64_9RHOB|nr:hypothetical protein [Pseudoroseicyclus tamaricis]NDV01249.1 hypothetical protein [Pseudoroseicyclus tamaricis]